MGLDPLRRRLVFRASMWKPAVLLYLLPSMAHAIPTPPCDGNDYGILIRDIDQVMLSGNIEDVRRTIDRGKEARGATVGCPDSGPSTNPVVITYAPPDFTVPTVDTLKARWHQKHEPAIAAFAQQGPLTLARDWCFTALGGYYARLSGQPVSLDALARIAAVAEGSQYSEAHAPWPPRKPPGMWGVPAGTSVDGRPDVCTMLPGLCATFNRGPFAGRTFTIADTDPPDYLEGGAAYDHGIFGIMMVEAAIQEPDAGRRQTFRTSALLAGEWSRTEPPVHNHNYTSKLIWLLAELYDWTGDPGFREKLLDKLARNLEPAVLMDRDGDGKVDGMGNQPFAGLALVAQRPGRLWDGHNARPEYNGMNAFAMVEAYVALRDRGDPNDAARLRPLAIAMLDNISWEVIHLGVPNKGKTQYPFALALGLHKVAAFENDPHPEWERAFVATWNDGAGDTPYQTAVYLLYRMEVPYVPLSRRAATTPSPDPGKAPGNAITGNGDRPGVDKERVGGCTVGSESPIPVRCILLALLLPWLERRRTRRFRS